MNVMELLCNPIFCCTRLEFGLHEELEDEYNDAPKVGRPPTQFAVNVTDCPSDTEELDAESFALLNAL